MKYAYFRFMGKLILFFYVIGLLLFIYDLSLIIEKNLDGFFIHFLKFLVYAIIAPAFGFLFLSHAKLLEKEVKIPTPKIEYSSSKFFTNQNPDWICECGGNNKSTATFCSTCGKIRK